MLLDIRGRSRVVIVGREANSFNPLSLEPTALYDPSNLATLFQDAAMTTPVTAHNDPVGAMLDLSGNGNHVTQGTAGLRPLYQTGGGLHWLLTDGSDDWLEATFAQGFPIERVMAARNVSYISSAGLWDGDTLNGLIFESGLDPDLAGFNGNQINLSGESTDVDMVITERWLDAGGTSRFAVDNNSYVTGDAGGNGAFTGLALGSRGGGTNNSNIRFYGGFIRSDVAVLLDADIARLRTFYAAKQGRSL